MKRLILLTPASEHWDCVIIQWFNTKSLCFLQHAGGDAQSCDGGLLIKVTSALKLSPLHAISGSTHSFLPVTSKAKSWRQHSPLECAMHLAFKTLTHQVKEYGLLLFPSTVRNACLVLLPFSLCSVSFVVCGSCQIVCDFMQTFLWKFCSGQQRMVHGINFRIQL